MRMEIREVTPLLPIRHRFTEYSAFTTTIPPPRIGVGPSGKVMQYRYPEPAKKARAKKKDRPNPPPKYTYICRMHRGRTYLRGAAILSPCIPYRIPHTVLDAAKLSWAPAKGKGKFSGGSKSITGYGYANMKVAGGERAFYRVPQHIGSFGLAVIGVSCPFGFAKGKLVRWRRQKCGNTEE